MNAKFYYSDFFSRLEYLAWLGNNHFDDIAQIALTIHNYYIFVNKYLRSYDEKMVVFFYFYHCLNATCSWLPIKDER